MPAPGGFAGAEAGQPVWLRQLQSQQQSNAAPGGPPPGGQPATFQAPGSAQGFGPPRQGRTFAAANLLSDDSLPEWLRAAPPVQPASARPFPQAQPPQGWWGAPDPAQFPQSGSLGQPQANAFAQPQVGPLRARMSGPLQPGTPASALFDESALPDWLRQSSAEQDFAQQQTAYQPAPGAQPRYGAPGMGAPYAPQSGYAAYQAAAAQQRPQAFPSIEQAGAFGAPDRPPSGVLSGPALIDPSALPSWLGGQPAAPRNAAPQSGGMAAHALIDEAALPAWLRAEPQAPASPPPAGPAPIGSGHLRPWAAPSPDDEPMPSWLHQVYTDANVPRTGTSPMSADPWAPAPPVAPQPDVRGQAGTMSASTFMDEAALPDWLRSQGAQPPITAQAAFPAGSWQLDAQERAMPTPAAPAAGWQREPGGGAGGSAQFAASDLVDPEALPSWVRGEGTQQAAFSSTLGWTSKQPAVQPGSDVLSAPFRDRRMPPTSGLLDPSVEQERRDARLHSSSLGGGPNASAWSAGTWGGQSAPLGGSGSGMLEPESAMSGYGDNGMLAHGQSGSLAYGESAPLGFGHSGPLREEYADARPRGSSELNDSPRRWAREQEYGEPQESASRRRGAPIPDEELPPWLRTAGPARDVSEGYGTGRMDEPDEGEWWPEDEDVAPGWTDWGDGEYAEADEDDEAYGDEDDRGHGGWRRFFGRR